MDDEREVAQEREEQRLLERQVRGEVDPDSAAAQMLDWLGR